jgi:hypothetical protein
MKPNKNGNLAEVFELYKSIMVHRETYKILKDLNQLQQTLAII